MGEDKSSISAARSYLEIGEYWDSHDSSDLWNEVPAAEFDMSAESQEVYYPLAVSYTHLTLPTKRIV